jgi:hypothetical protein
VKDGLFDVTRGERLAWTLAASDVVVEHNDIRRAGCGANEIGCFRIAYAAQFVLIIETMHSTPMVQHARAFHFEPKRSRLAHVTYLNHMLHKLDVGFLCPVWRIGIGEERPVTGGRVVHGASHGGTMIM